jgi:hypothetical protein
LKIATLADFCGTRWQVNAVMIPTPGGKSYMMPVALEGVLEVLFDAPVSQTAAHEVNTTARDRLKGADVGCR